MNTLFYGDNLAVLRESIPTESVDLIYLDPPFNSNATYNVLFRAPAGQQSEAQLEAFDDTWHWGDSAEQAFADVIRSRHTNAATMLKAMRSALGENDMMAYLAMMAARLIELHRALKPTGSLYLHCDPTASHYLKIIMDAIFDNANFTNEISWRRTSTKSDFAQGATHFPRLRDVILRYSKSAGIKPVYHQPFSKYDDDYIHSKYPHTDKDGRKFGLWDMTGPGGAAKGNPEYAVMGITRFWRFSKARMDALIAEGRVVQPRPGAVPRYKRYLDEMSGVPIGDDWDDIDPINSQAEERLGYPTQKPLALLERIIAASSNPGDVVLDPFCGCGTAVHAAQKLGRAWIGIDITHLSISLIERRLKDAFPDITFDVQGTPKDLGGARDLALRSKDQFQWWAVSLVDAVPQGGIKKKGMDRGIDGIRWVTAGPKPGDVEKVIVSVKGGENVNSGMVRDLKGTMERESAIGGLFVMLAEPTREMKREAAAAGVFNVGFGDHPKLQILTIQELLAGLKPSLPPIARNEGFRRAPRETGPKAKQTDLGL